MLWYKQLGFKDNPLDIRPNPMLIGLEEEEEEVRNYIEKEQICFLNGLTGSGKTSLLTKIQQEMQDHNFIYLDAQDLPKDFNLEEELKKKRNFFDKISLRKFPKKKPVLIIDEFQDTDPNIILEARSNWESPKKKKIRSIIIAQISKHLRNTSDSFKERIGNRAVTLKLLDEEQMKEILRRRLYLKSKKKQYFKKLSPEAVDLIVHLAGNNPRRLLEYTDMVFDFHARRFGKINPVLKDDYKITYHGAKEILSLNKINVDSFEEKTVPTQVVRESDTFEKLYDETEREILGFLLQSGPSSYPEIGKFMNMSKPKIQKIISELKQKKGVRAVKRKGNEKYFDISPEAKRLSVKE